MNINKFLLYNRTLQNQLNSELNFYLKRDTEKEEQYRMDSIKTIEILHDMVDEELNHTNQKVYQDALNIFS